MKGTQTITDAGRQAGRSESAPRWGRALLASVLLVAIASTVSAGDKYDPKLTKCRMVFNIKGWSLFVKMAKGTGTITCDNGQRAEVRLKSVAGGLTAGKSEMTGARGTFTPVRGIQEIFGTYAEAEAHAGAAKSASVSVLTKGVISLAIRGRGRGVDLGVSVGSFTIEPK